MKKERPPIKKFSGEKWTNDKHYRVPYAQKVKGLVDIFAAWDPHNERIYYRFYVGKMPIYSSTILNGHSIRFFIKRISILSWMAGVFTNRML